MEAEGVEKGVATGIAIFVAVAVTFVISVVVSKFVWDKQRAGKRPLSAEFWVQWH